MGFRRSTVREGGRKRRKPMSLLRPLHCSCLALSSTFHNASDENNNDEHVWLLTNLLAIILFVTAIVDAYQTTMDLSHLTVKTKIFFFDFVRC